MGIGSISMSECAPVNTKVDGLMSKIAKVSGYVADRIPAVICSGGSLTMPDEEVIDEIELDCLIASV